ncbi:DUF6798 domain-containing protein [Aeoliella mucimassa]|uniref:DUF6798 domain-containing protein n=1 Tax=Aeoliella mucimassa TaxID=2527972 RepID=A0A518AR47_9BACT|nr:DUF6798 domain-containing protein [Aeoliella mucimassa]QDU57193.1 hypothetical protein Pan181_34070 [Aeoliella mucimassa]
MSTTPAETSPTPPTRPLWFWGEIALIVAIFYVSSAAPPPGVNEPHYLCRLRHALEPQYCPNDLFLESPDAHYTFVLAFAWMTQVMSFTAAAWVGRLACWFALSWAWLRLSWTVVPRPLYASLAAAIVITAIAEGNFAGEWLVGGFEAKTVAYVFVVLGLRCWVLNKWNWTWAHLGIASAWHALVGGWSVLILLKLWGAIYRFEQSFRGMLPGLAIGGIVALAGVVPALALSMGASPEVRNEAAEIYVFERLPHHLAPLHKKPGWITERAGRHAVVATLFVAMLFVRRKELGGTWRALKDDPAGRIAQYAVGAAVLAMIGMVIELALWNHPSAAASWLRYYWFRLVDVAVPMALALLWIAELRLLLERKDRWATPLLLSTILLAGYPIAERYTDFLYHPIGISDRKARDFDDWMACCEWIEANTPTDAMFLTPRGNTSFKWYAKRAEVVTYKDVPQDAEHLVEWRRRLYDVFKPDGDRSQPWISCYGELGADRVDELAQAYQVDYILTGLDPPLPYPIVFMTDTYVVYQLHP